MSFWNWILPSVAVVAGVMILIQVGRLVAMGSFYRRLFCLAHYREVARGLEALRDLLSEDAETATDPERARLATLTSCGLAIAHSRHPRGDDAVHHFSVATRRGITRAAGQTFLSFVVWRLGLEPSRCESWLGVNAYHLELTLSKKEEAELPDRFAPLSPELDAAAVRSAVLSVRKQLYAEG